MRRFTVVLTISLVLCGAAAARATFPLTVADALGRTVIPLGAVARSTAGS